METHFVNIEHAQSSLARKRVVEDLRALVRDSEILLKATAGDVCEGARAARERLRVALARARCTCDEVQREAVVAAKAAAKKADAVVREHPYGALGVAFGVGVLIGVLAGRRGSRE